MPYKMAYTTAVAYKNVMMARRWRGDAWAWLRWRPCRRGRMRVRWHQGTSAMIYSTYTVDDQLMMYVIDVGRDCDRKAGVAML